VAGWETDWLYEKKSIVSASELWMDKVPGVKDKTTSVLLRKVSVGK
jgi:hypothetical protein